MDNPRIFLWLALLFIVWLNVSAWLKDYGQPGAPSQPPAATAAAPAPGAGSQLAESLPTVGAPPPAGGAAATPESGVPGSAVFTPGSVVHVSTDVLDMDIALTGGDIVRADLLQYPLKKDNPAVKVRLFNTDAADSLYLYESGLTTGEAGRAEPNHKAQFNATAAEFRLEPGQEELQVPLSWTDGQGLVVTKTYVLRRGGYAIDVRYDVDNGTAQAVPLTPYAQLLRHWTPVERSMFNVETYAFRGPAVYDGEKYRKLKVDDKDDQQFKATVTGGWVAALQHHFVAAIVPQPAEAYRFALKVQDKDYLLRVVGPTETVAAGAKGEIKERLFVGPKLQEQLKVAGPELQRVADYGKLTILSQPLFWLLEKIHSVIGNWGWTIIIVTFLIKLVFYKLAETSGRSMAKMRTMAPRMKVIQERFKDDREGQARAMMELYKREKINPVAGCLPMIVQIPFFLAFYWVLLESVEMRQAPFMFWIQDLSSRDPFFILPLLMGGAMFLQFKLNPTPADPVQAKVFAFMPIVMTAMFAWFPAGLVLYWLTNTLLSIAQQYKINKLVEAEEKKRRTN
jgi:YidC/Oxa1 family membrane protein insertase